jgi:hypothetical protein
MSSSSKPGSPAPRSGPEAWLTPGRFAGLLALLIVVSFPQVVAGLESFFYKDAGWFAYPVAFYHRESFWHGEVPLWNPLNNCGTPFLAQWNTMSLYPLSLVYLLLPMPWSFGIFCLGHFLIAGLGMYFLARRWTENPLAAAAAGTVFAFNGFTWYGLMWPHLLAAIAWMPWVVHAMSLAWCKGGRWVVIAALCGAMQVLTGGAEVIGQTWLFVALILVIQLVRAQTPRPQVASRALAAMVLIAGLSAAQTLPFLDLLLHSQRNANYVGSLLAAMPSSGWANYLVPLFHCVPNSQGVYVQPDQPFTASYYLGIGPIALAVFALWRGRDRRIRLLGAVALAGLVMALGGHTFLYDAIKRIFPLLGYIRFPIKFVILVNFAVPLLAAFGLARLQSVPNEDLPREWSAARAVAAALVALIALIVCIAVWHPFPGAQSSVTAVNGAVRIGFLLLILGCLAWLRADSSLRPQRLGQTLLIALLWFDVFTHAPALAPTAASSAAAPDVIRQYLKWGDGLRPGSSRAMETRAAFFTMLTTFQTNIEVDLQGRRAALFNDLNLLDHAAKIDGFYSLDLKDYTDVLNQLYYNTNNPASKLKDFLGISLASDPNDPVAWAPRSNALPIITAGQRPIFADPLGTLEGILGESFQPLGVVYLRPGDDSAVSVTGAAVARVTPGDFSAQRIRFNVTAGAPAMVVIVQAFDHSWRAYVDGAPTPLLQANYAFQALQVPAGRHEVRLVYKDRNFRHGVVLALLSLCVCLAAWIRWKPGAA